MKECPLCHTCYEDSVGYCPQDGQELSKPYPWPLTLNDKYRLDALIGRGGMSAVYRAIQLELAREVAIKFLLPDSSEESAAYERFRREALTSALIDHPNVVTIYDYGTLPNGVGYLVMKLLRGHTLTREIRTTQQLPFDRVFNIVFQICSAIETAHRLGVIHCDLKPDNIILEETEDGEKAQILDFGIAKIVKDSSTRLTAGGVVFGTPTYMSPEQCESRDLDFRSDIYSLGLIIYEMLTGVAPFRGSNSTIIAKQHLNKLPLPPSILRPAIKPKLEQVILKALAKNREDRQQSASELTQSLWEAAKELVSAGLLDATAIPQMRRPRHTQKIPNVLAIWADEDSPTRIVAVPEDSAKMTNAALSLDTSDLEKLKNTAPDANSVQTVLVVEDELPIQMLLEEVITRLGCQVLVANNGRQALGVLETKTPDLIISDVMMPIMNGYQFYAELRKHLQWAEIPLIFLTARTGHDEKLAALEKGVEDFWTKPFDITEISLRLQRILRRIKHLQELRSNGAPL
jgi:serine/threonine protein kinase